MVSSLTDKNSLAISYRSASLPGTSNFVYGGTPSDPSVVRCIRDLKSRGLNVIFYPFLLGTGRGFSMAWPHHFARRSHADGDERCRGIHGPARQSADFIQDFDQSNGRLLRRSGPFDWTYPSHDFALCEPLHSRRRSQSVRDWIGASRDGNPAGSGLDEGWRSRDGSGTAIWDYPMVAALNTLANDVRTTFDNLGFAKNATTLENLICYSADWSSWMGWQHRRSKTGSGRIWTSSRPIRTSTSSPLTITSR